MALGGSLDRNANGSFGSIPDSSCLALNRRVGRVPYKPYRQGRAGIAAAPWPGLMIVARSLPRSITESD